MFRYRGYRKPKFKRPRYRPYGRNYIVDFIKAYIVFFLIIGGIVFVVTRIGIVKPGKESAPSKKIVLINIKRSEAFKRGMNMINYTWTFNSQKNGVKSSSEVELPKYLKDLKEQRVSGIPYAWGGYISLDISDQKGAKGFEEAIEEGYTAGNVACMGGYKDLTAGLDCSGFVSAVFKLNEKISTRNLEGFFHEIDMKDLKPMDILNCYDHHVMIYLAPSLDRKGIIAMESTTGTDYDSPEKTVISFRSWEEIQRGDKNKPYIAMRYNNIVDDEVKLFKDTNEFNNHMSRAKEIVPDSPQLGCIDFVEDVDYFKYVVSNSAQILIKISKLPDNSVGEILSQSGNPILKLTQRKDYSIELPKGTYFIRFSGLDFKYNPDAEYEFELE